MCLIWQQGSLIVWAKLIMTSLRFMKVCVARVLIVGVIRGQGTNRGASTGSRGTGRDQ